MFWWIILLYIIWRTIDIICICIIKKNSLIYIITWHKQPLPFPDRIWCRGFLLIFWCWGFSFHWILVKFCIPCVVAAPPRGWLWGRPRLASSKAACALPVSTVQRGKAAIWNFLHWNLPYISIKAWQLLFCDKMHQEKNLLLLYFFYPKIFFMRDWYSFPLFFWQEQKS